MADPRDKEKKEEDPVEQVVSNLTNAMDDLELADDELDQDLSEIKQSASAAGEDQVQAQDDNADDTSTAPPSPAAASPQQSSVSDTTQASSAQSSANQDKVLELKDQPAQEPAEKQEAQNVPGKTNVYTSPKDDSDT